jgi:hypothetical protein
MAFLVDYNLERHKVQRDRDEEELTADAQRDQLPVVQLL